MQKIVNWIKKNPHCLALLYLIIYLIVFFTLERVTQPKFIIHSRLDDFIPFCEWFAIFYISWLAIFPASLIFFLFYSKEDYQNLCFILMNGATLCFICYILFPTALDLRIEIEGGNILSDLMKLLWSIDTPTNVCPSLHVSISSSIALVAFKSKKMKASPILRWGTIIWMFMICISTVFVKQHSVIDIYCGILVTALFGFIAYRLDWKKFVAKTPFKFML